MNMPGGEGLVALVTRFLGYQRGLVFSVPGGRDKRGAPVITITPTDHSDMTPVHLGKLLAYFSKIPEYVCVYVCTYVCVCVYVLVSC